MAHSAFVICLGCRCMAISKMRWSDADQKEFARIRKNFNAKRQRLLAKDPTQAAFLPPELRITDIYSRDDFKRIKRTASMFTERGSEKKVKFHGEEVPVYFKKRLQYMQKVENARRARKRQQFTPERGTQNMAKEAAFQPMRMKGRRSLVDMLKAQERLQGMFLDKDKQKKMQLYKDNYLRALRDKLGPLAGPIEELIKGLPAAQFVKAIEEDYELSIDFVYDYIDALIKAEAIFNRWYNLMSDWKPETYDPKMQDELYQAAYEDVMEEDWNDITERSSVIKGTDVSWTDNSPEEIAKLFDERHSRYKRAGKVGEYIPKAKPSADVAKEALSKDHKNIKFTKDGKTTKMTQAEYGKTDKGVDFSGFTGDEIIKATIELERLGLPVTKETVLAYLKKGGS